jgi:hypothetical protein
VSPRLRPGLRPLLLLLPVLFGVLALLLGMWAGLVRLGWGLPPIHATLTLVHGPLMLSGFLGTLIGLERAVALGAGWAFAAPALTALGTVVTADGPPGPAGPLVFSLGSLVLVVSTAAVVSRQPTPASLLMGLGALAWLAGNIVWLVGAPVQTAVPWWAGFLVLTIVGERLLLSRLIRPSTWGRAAAALALGLYLLGTVLSGISSQAGGQPAGWRLAGAGMLGLALWLFRYDPVRFTSRQPGQARFVAICLLSGFAWLGISGLLWLASGGVAAGPHYDAMLHSLFLGFVFAMIFGHAPIMLPAVLGRPVPFRLAFYAHLVLLHASLLVRLAGDLAALPAARQWGGLLNVAALLLFMVNTFLAVRSAARCQGAAAG